MSNNERWVAGVIMEKFDLELAKNGHPVCTRDGRDVRILCFDKKGGAPLLGLIRNKNSEIIGKWKKDGTEFIARYPDPNDLLMRHEKGEN